jgi:hypothetical protein
MEMVVAAVPADLDPENDDWTVSEGVGQNAAEKSSCLNH